MNLIYLVAVGAAEPRFMQAASWCITSARRFGMFAGDIVVLTDCEPHAFTAEAREQARIVSVDERRLRDTGHGRSARHRYQIARLQFPSLFDVGGYEAVMYLDADVLCIRDIRPLFECGSDFRYSCEFQPMSAPMYSGCLTEEEIAEARWRRGVNSGVFVAPADYLAECFGVWREILDGRPDAQAYDQPALNAAVFRKLIRARPLPYFAVAYPVLGNFAFHLREQTCLLHYCGLAEKKFARMGLHYEDLCAGGPVRVDFGDAVPPPAPPAWTSPVAGRRYVIALNDSFRGVEAFSITNAAWRRELGARGHSIQELSASADRLDFVIHHNYAVDFAEPLPESSGKHIAVRTSDLGPYPPAWVDLINRSYDQLWVRSRWIQGLALESGIDPERLRLIPNGFDPEVFRPEGPTADLPTAKRFRFLFVGGAVVRKGFDVLLRAYTGAFGPEDEVVLIVKDAGAANCFYDKRPFREEIRRIQSDPSAPELLYIDDHLPVRELAALYRSCDCAVFPYRAEGFVIPALEALACGRPTIVPDLGPSTDYSNATTSLLVPALHIRLPVGRTFRMKLGHDLEVAQADFCEVRVTSLMTAMRRAYECGATERRAMGLAGARLVHGAFTWKHVADQIETQLRELDDGRSPVRHR